MKWGSTLIKYMEFRFAVVVKFSHPLVTVKLNFTLGFLERKILFMWHKKYVGIKISKVTAVTGVLYIATYQKHKINISVEN